MLMNVPVTDGGTTSGCYKHNANVLGSIGFIIRFYICRALSDKKVFIMEFTKLLKQGSAVLFLILLTHGLVLGFSNQTTILAIVLAAVVCLFEAQLVKSERDEQEQRMKNIVAELQNLVNKFYNDQKSLNASIAAQREEDIKAILKIHEDDKKEMLERIASTHSQLSALKLNQGIRKL